jgi:hypothetical protein
MKLRTAVPVGVNGDATDQRLLSNSAWMMSEEEGEGNDDNGEPIPLIKGAYEIKGPLKNKSRSRDERGPLIRPRSF